MSDVINQVLERIRELETQLEDELHRRSDELQYQFKNGKIIFEKELRQRNKKFKTSLFNYIRDARWLVILTAPFIYTLIIPFVLLDIFVNLYQTVCFPVYGIPKVKRSNYLVFDRVKLDYLNGLEKLNCTYCSYGNGIIAFTSEVAACTEQYWCPIKHAQKVRSAHSRYPVFTDFGDGEQYRRELGNIKKKFDVTDT